MRKNLFLLMFNIISMRNYQTQRYLGFINTKGGITSFMVVVIYCKSFCNVLSNQNEMVCFNVDTFYKTLYQTSKPLKMIVIGITCYDLFS